MLDLRVMEISNSNNVEKIAAFNSNIQSSIVESFNDHIRTIMNGVKKMCDLEDNSGATFHPQKLINEQVISCFDFYGVTWYSVRPMQTSAG